MSVLRSSAFPIVFVVLLAAVAACGGTASPGSNASILAGATPSSDDGTGTESNPPIVIGQFTKGTFHADVSGDATGTLDLAANGGFSAEGTTIINYGETGGDQASMIISPELVGVSASMGALSIAGSTTDANHCDAVITQSDATRLAGTFDCGRLVTYNGTTGTNINVTMRGTFEAAP
jgi:hypothetical protein